MEKFIEIEGQKICYSESGPADGTNILLMHGWGCDHTTVASIEKHLNPRMHVYSIDFPGHGKSPEPAEVWGVEKYTRLTEKFIQAMGGDIHILLGHSFGGRVGILLSSRNDYVRKLILVDAAGIKNPLPLKKVLKIYSYKAAKHFLRFTLGSRKAEPILERIRRKRGSADYASASPRMRAILSKCVNENLKDRLPHIKADTLLIWGENDTATPLSDAKTMERLIPNAGLVSWPGCGHYSFLDNTVGFRAVLSSYLKDELN